MKDNKLRIFIFYEMLIIAMTAISIPTLIPTFQEQFSLSIGESSLIPIISTIGGFFANLAASFFSSKIGLKRMNLIFLVIGLTAAIILAFSENILLFYLGISLIGITVALGLTNSSTIFAHLRKDLQNYGFYHACFGVGGIISPAVITYLLAKNYSYKNVFILIAAFYIITIIIVRFTNLIENKKYDSINLKEAFHILKKKYVYLVLIIIIIYAGSEQGIIAWSSNLFIDKFSFSKENASFFLSVFWICFTLGRMATQFIEGKLGSIKTVVVAASLFIVNLILLLISGNPLFFGLLACSMAPIFPVVQKYTSSHLPHRELGLFNGLVFAFTSLGNVFIAGLMGLLGEISLIYSFIVPIAVGIAVLFIMLDLRRS